jgi:hypothetical protein
MAFIASNSVVRSSWFVSLASRNDGDDMEENSCRSLALEEELRFSK